VVAAPRWLGASENRDLEYKGAAALRDPSAIARAAVAMLNAGGGTVVVGVDDGGAVAGVDTPQHERDRLQQQLVDRIRPRPLHEVDVVVVEIGAVSVLEVRACPRTGTLYADRSGGRWGFWLRSGATSRALEWEEIVRLWPSAAAAPVDFAASAPRWDEGVPERWPGASAVLVLRSVRDPAAGDSVTPKWEAIRDVLARAPHSLDPGRLGWQVTRGLRAEDIVKGTWDQRPARWLRLSRNLDLRFEGGEHYLAHQQPDRAPWRALYPYPVTEGPASFLRLLAMIAGEFPLTGAIDVTMALWTTGGWGLAPGAPQSYGWRFGLPDRGWPPAAPDPVRVATRTTWGELRAAPGRVAHRLVSDFYAEFGWDSDAVPFWDSDEGEFRFR
jgi:hypothetical protein